MRIVSNLKTFYRSVLFQIIVLGFVSFTQPGVWGAANSLGAGGQSTPFLVNTSNGIIFGIMAISCSPAGGLCNLITSKWTLVIGVMLYVNHK